MMRSVNLFSTFLLLGFLLSGCSNFEYSDGNVKAVYDNNGYHCEYVKGVRLNCVKMEIDDEEKEI